MSVVKALYEGFIGELNQRWKNNDFYFWLETLCTDTFVISCQHYAFGRHRQFLKIAIKEAVVQVIRVRSDAAWEVVNSLELDNPKLLDELHHVIEKELKYV